MGRWGTRATRALVALTLETYGDTCHLCGRPGATTGDHIIPRSQGGTDTLENMRPAHATCNYARQDMPLDKWRATHPIRLPKSRPSRTW